jgi:hypothetical protein
MSAFHSVVHNIPNRFLYSLLILLVASIYGIAAKRQMYQTK